MTTPIRYLIAAALLATLAACGNKGPLVKASQVPPADAAAAAPVDNASPPPSDPTDATAPEEIAPPPVTDPASATPAADGGGNG
ncbi:MAG TPA: lipoprotein [Luteimonas sp.]|nr:lipoprotein [Luteimonas sp.]